jgi:nicotinate-nucleotide adenylyltransferase
MRIAFFGGSFDPPHRGHLAIAEAAANRLSLDRVLLAPVGLQPLKTAHSSASFAHRLAMVRLAVNQNERLVASEADAPLPGGEPNYTFDTLVRLRRTLSAADTLFLLVGADSMRTLPKWRRSSDLLLFCNLILAGRPGFPRDRIPFLLPPGLGCRPATPENGVSRLELTGDCARRSTIYLLPELSEPVSGTEVRRELAADGKLAGLLAPPVLNYITVHRLYRS